MGPETTGSGKLMAVAGALLEAWQLSEKRFERQP
jgi:hypothetical protein